MKQKNINTTYIPLQKPYRIIKYGNKMGVQIGTQVVTITYENPFKIETHNYPYVAIENNDTTSKDIPFDVDESSEGEVWDNVDSKKVYEIAKLDSPISWDYFIKVLWHDHARLGDRQQKIQKYYIFKKLLKYYQRMEVPGPGMYTIHLYTEMREEKPYVVRSMEDDTFALNVAWHEDPEALEKAIEADLMDYLLILSPNRSTNNWILHYETQEERLLPLVERLNANDITTRFKNRIMGNFTVRCIMPYGDSTPPLPHKREIKKDKKSFDPDTFRETFTYWPDGMREEERAIRLKMAFSRMRGTLIDFNTHYDTFEALLSGKPLDVKIVWIGINSQLRELFSQLVTKGKLLIKPTGGLNKILTARFKKADGTLFTPNEIKDAGSDGDMSAVDDIVKYLSPSPVAMEDLEIQLRRMQTEEKERGELRGMKNNMHQNHLPIGTNLSSKPNQHTRKSNKKS